MLARTALHGYKDDDTNPGVVKDIAPGVVFPNTPGNIKNYEVGVFGSGDPELAMNMCRMRKGMLLVTISVNATISTWGSAIIAPAAQDLMEYFHIGLPVAVLTTSLYVLGYSVGPIIWGPLSTLYGRKMTLVLSSFGITLFLFAAATAKDYQTLVLSRFFQGVFGACAITVGPAVIGDSFGARTRGQAVTSAALSIVVGPMLAPITGAYITQSYLGWRWTMYLTGILAAFATIANIIFIPETYTPRILQYRAARLRTTTGNWAICASGDLNSANIGKIIDDVFSRPLKMLLTEPILALVTIYHAFMYGILYMCLEAVPIIFSNFGFPGANAYLPYISLLIGSLVVCAINVVLLEPRYTRQLEKYRKSVMPENRLPLMILSGVVFVIGIFWLCWTGAYPKYVHWIVPTIGASFVGFGIVGIFLAAFNYLLDTYLMLSAQAFAANTFFRSGFGCAFPLFVHPMFINLGTQWAGTIIGCLSLLLVPVPVLFYVFGAKLRSISPFAVNLDDSDGNLNIKEDEG